jgi:hypothetical protein
MDQCEIIDIYTWRYCNIGHIDGMRFRGIVNPYAINVANIANLYTIDVAT